MDEQEQQGARFADAEGMTFGSMEAHGTDEPGDTRPPGPAKTEAPANGPLPLGPLGEPQDATAEPGMPLIDRHEGAPPIESFPIETASEEALKGTAYDVLNDAMRPMFANAFRRLSQGDRVAWTLAAAMVPHPQNPSMGTITPVLYVEMPGTVLNTVITQNVVFQQFAGWTQDSVDDAVRQILEACRQQRSGQVDQMLNAQSRTNGGGSGLIVPGM